MGVSAPPSLFAGPAEAGDSVTYRVSKTMGATQAPDVWTLVITWKAPAKLYARLAGSPGCGANRDALRRRPTFAGGTEPRRSLRCIDCGAPRSIEFSRARCCVARWCRPCADVDEHHAAGAFERASPAPAQAPPPVDVPLDINLLRNTSGITLIADGNSNQRGSSFGGDRGGRGGGMGSSRQGGSMGSSMAAGTPAARGEANRSRTQTRRRSISRYKRTTI